VREAYILKNMLFVLSKILYFLLSPLSVAILVFTGAMVAIQKKRYALAQKFGVVGWLVLVVFGVLPTGQYLTVKLQELYPMPAELPRKVTGIVLLGGFIDTDMGLSYGTPQVNATADRLHAFVDMAQKYPYARLVFTAGQGAILQNGTPEGPMVNALLSRMKINTRGRLLIEDQSRTTAENASYTYALIQPKPEETWLLVTSAWHMPRAMGAFRAAGWPNMVPVPSDYATTDTVRFNWNFMENMALSQMAIKEIGGMVVYALTGRWKAE
jgi:uncharacterized SAM-binding protein YcdF (DUF218 family)